MLAIKGSSEWSAAHTGATIGLLELSGAENRQPSEQFNQFKRDTEARLRTIYTGFNRKEFLSLPVMAAYDRYYRRFDKTYHVLLQVESIVTKGKNLPDVSPLVDANFASEVSSFVLTAGHDADLLEAPVCIDVSREEDQITPMNGVTRLIRAGDMVMRDRGGVCCSILYGQDHRSPITTATTHVLYVAYAPPGVPGEAVQTQLDQIERAVRLFAPRAVLEQKHLISAG